MLRLASMPKLPLKHPRDNFESDFNFLDMAKHKALQPFAN